MILLDETKIVNMTNTELQDYIVAAHDVIGAYETLNISQTNLISAFEDLYTYINHVYQAESQCKKFEEKLHSLVKEKSNAETR